MASSLTPREDLCAFRLWHPDLHPSNTLISEPNLPDITAVIDWQGACIDLLLTAGSLPDFMAYSGGKYVPQPSPPGNTASTPVLPERFADLDDVEKQKAQGELKAVKRYHVYTMFTEGYNSTLHRHRTHEELLELCTWPLYWASRTWDEGLGFFERCLIMICDSWDSINPDMPCPIEFTAEERSANKRSLSIWIRDQVVEKLVSEIGVQPDGVVDHDKLEEARRRNVAVMEQFVAALPEHECGTPTMAVSRWCIIVDCRVLQLTVETLFSDYVCIVSSDVFSSALIFCSVHINAICMLSSYPFSFQSSGQALDVTDQNICKTE